MTPQPETDEEPTMDIGEAIEAMRDNAAVRREGWNGKGMWIKLQIPDGNSKMSAPYVYMKTATNDLIPWLCSQADLLANDWQLVDDEEVAEFEETKTNASDEDELDNE